MSPEAKVGNRKLVMTESPHFARNSLHSTDAVPKEEEEKKKKDAAFAV